MRAASRSNGRISISVVALAAAANPVIAQVAGMPESVPAALAMERQDALPMSRFYDAPRSLEATPPGHLLRSEDGHYSLSVPAKATRILYVSTDGRGTKVATSAVVLVPEGTPPAGGWPVIAWAHGTSGMARMCAPSLMRDVYYGDEGLSDMIKAGFAVVASDYHGLGTVGPHRYMDKAAQAEDVVNALPAARSAVPALSRTWVVDGHSQGGLAAWAVAERQRLHPDAGYKGAIAVAGATHLGWLLDHPEATKGTGFYLAWHAYAIHTRYPSFDVTRMLTPLGQSHYDDVTKKGCWFYGFASYRGVEAPQMVRPGWKAIPQVRRFMLENSAGSTPIDGPILVIAGGSDGAVPIDGIRDTVKRACVRRSQVTFHVYDGLDHDETMAKSTPEQLAWIRDRMAGKAAPGNCGR